MSDETANEKQGRVLAQNPMEWGDTPDGETEPKWAVKPGKRVPKKDWVKAPRIDQHNHETEPGQTEPWDMLHPGEQKED